MPESPQVLLHCAYCGKPFTALRKEHRKYCSAQCAHFGSGVAHANSGKRSRPWRAGSVVIRSVIDGLFISLQPVIGKPYPARIWDRNGNYTEFCAIEIGGKSIVLRPGEYQEIAEGTA